MRRKKGWMKLKVKKIRQETPDTETFFFVNEEEDERAFDYIAGQYLTFRFDDIGDKPLVRSYTMSSSPKKHDEALVSVKRVYKGVVSNWMCDEIKEGLFFRFPSNLRRFGMVNLILTIIFTVVIFSCESKVVSRLMADSRNFLLRHKSINELNNVLVLNQCVWIICCGLHCWVYKKYR